MMMLSMFIPRNIREIMLFSRTCVCAASTLLTIIFFIFMSIVITHIEVI
jgi:hypothetical protein